MKFVCDACKSDGMGACVIEVNFNDGLDNRPWKCPYDDGGEVECNWHKVAETPLKAHRNGGDAINHPNHYCEGRKYEPIDVIEDWELDFCLGNALKYISRAGRKDSESDDLKKAVWYINRRIEQVERWESQRI